MNFNNISIVVVLIFLFLSCSKEEKKLYVGVPPSAKAGSLYLDSDIYKIGETELPSQSGFIVFPENRDNPQSRLIELPVIQIKAIGDSVAEPIFFLNGGPGSPNIGSYHFVKNFIENHDIVLLGYRGAEGSVVLNLPEVDEFFANMPGNLTERSTLDSMSNAFAKGARRLQNEGVDTDGYTITEVIEDLEETRKALGYNKINLLSVSYGTRLAMIYDWMYSNVINRSAMMCVNPPGHFEWRPEVMDDHLNHYSELYKKDLKFGDPNINLAEVIRRASRNIPESWVFIPIKKDYVLMSTFMMLYSVENAPPLFDAWLAADKGDWSGIAMLSLTMDFMLAGSMNWGDLVAKSSSADYVFDANKDLLAEFLPDSSVIGAPGTLLGIGSLGWPSKLIPDSLRKVKYSETQTLLINGNVDVSTPARFAKEKLLPYLPNGQMVIISEASHSPDLWGSQRPALDHMLKTFFKTGVVDASRYTHLPISFEVSWGFPTIMKLVLIAIAFVMVILILVTWFIVKKIKRKKAKRKEHQAAG